MKSGKIFPPEFSEESLGLNPFIAGLVIKVRAIKSGYVPDGEEEGLLVDNVVELERDGYVKVYDGASQRVIVMGLSYRALQVWTWMLYTVRSGKDYLWVNVERVMVECGGMKSVKTYKSAITELCRYGFIAPCVGVKNVYWLNPYYAFKGSRIKKYPKNVVVSKTNE